MHQILDSFDGTSTHKPINFGLVGNLTFKVTINYNDIPSHFIMQSACSDKMCFFTSKYVRFAVDDFKMFGRYLKILEVMLILFITTLATVAHVNIFNVLQNIISV